MAQLTVKQFQSKLAAKAAELAKENLPLKIAAQTVHAFRVKRLFHDGIAGAAYDKTRELWVADNQLRRRGNHKGKPFKIGKKFKSGKRKGQDITWVKVNNKTTYYENYYELKKQQGFNPDVVNLRMTNDFQSDFANVQLNSRDNAVPTKATPIKINANLYVERLDREISKGKLKGFKKKYNNPFPFTKEERKLFNEIAQQELLKLLKK